MKLPQIEPTVEQRQRALRQLCGQHPHWPTDLETAERDHTKRVVLHALAVALARRDLKQQRQGTHAPPCRAQPPALPWRRTAGAFDPKRACANDRDDD